jgi:hypothetical protein
MPNTGAAGRIRSLPLFVVLIGVSALAMLIPASYGIAVRDWTSARAFTQSALLVGLLAAMIGLAASGRAPRVLAQPVDHHGGGFLGIAAGAGDPVPTGGRGRFPAGLRRNGVLPDHDGGKLVATP